MVHTIRQVGEGGGNGIRAGLRIQCRKAWGFESPPSQSFREVQGMKSQLLLVLFSMLSMFVGCEGQQEHGDGLGRGFGNFTGEYYWGHYESRRGLIDLLILINAEYGLTYVISPPSPGIFTITVWEKDYTFEIIPDYQKGEVTIDGEVFKMASGIVFLCDVSDEHVKVKQVAQRAGKVPCHNVKQEIERLAKENPVIKEWLMGRKR